MSDDMSAWSRADYEQHSAYWRPAHAGMSLSMVEHYSRAVDQLRLGDEAIGKMEA